MSTQSNITDVKLHVYVENGTSASGKTALKSLNYNQIRLDATEEELMKAGKAIAALQSKPLSTFKTITTRELTEDGE